MLSNNEGEKPNVVPLQLLTLVGKPIIPTTLMSTHEAHKL
jgi:hypothetical protein